MTGSARGNPNGRHLGRSGDDDPTDRLIRRLWQGRRTATLGELAQIQGRIAAAQFNPDQVDVPERWRGRTYTGILLGERVDSLLVHTLQRVWRDKQWALGTTPEQYLADLRRSLRDPGTELVLYESRGALVVGALAPNRVPQSRRGRAVGPFVYAVYSVSRGILLTGYQVAGRQGVPVPGDRWWLR